MKPYVKQARHRCRCVLCGEPKESKKAVRRQAREDIRRQANRVYCGYGDDWVSLERDAEERAETYEFFREPWDPNLCGK